MKKILLTTALALSFGAAAQAEEFNPKISMEQAKKIALDTIKNKLKIVEAEVEREEGKDWVYEIEVGIDSHVWEVELNSDTGEIMEIEKEYYNEDQ